MIRLRAILAKGLEATADLWPDVRLAFGWVRRAAAVPRNKRGPDAAGVQRIKSNPTAKRGGGTIWYSVSDVEKLLRSRMVTA